MVDLHLIDKLSDLKLSHLIPELVPGDQLGEADLASEESSELSSEALLNCPDPWVDFTSKARQRWVDFHLARYRSDSLSSVEVARSADELLRLYRPYLQSWILFSDEGRWG